MVNDQPTPPSTRGLFDFAVRRPIVVIGAFLLMSAIALFGVARLQQEEDLLTFLPTKDRDVRLFRDVSQRFGGLRVALVGVETPASEDVFAADPVRRIADATTAVKNTTGIDYAMSITTVPDIVAGPTGVELHPLIDHPPANEAEHAALRAKLLANETVAGSLVSTDGRAALIMAFLADG